MKGRNLQPRTAYPERLSFRFEGERNNFIDKQKLKQFSTTKLTLQEILKGLFRGKKITTNHVNTAKRKTP